MKHIVYTRKCIFFCTFFTLLFVTVVAAQAQVYNPAFSQKQLKALRIQEEIKVDGELSEAIWRQAEIATNFIQNRPTPGPAETHPTEVRILYDDEAIYVGAIMHDVSQDSILRELGRRDDLGNTDFFGVFFDTYNDQLNGFGFFTTPAGVQQDARYSTNGEDWSWSAVWESSVSMQGTNWVAEFKIPYSAIRFSSKPEQLWGLNFMRNRQITRKGYFWNHVDPAKDGLMNQFGKLTGIKDIKAPLRLSLSPYVAASAASFPYKKESSEEISTKTDFNFSGGLDVKYGISDAFTLDMTLIPDFSQVQSDNQVLNLGPFEVQYNENRPFFMEGTELFNKGGFFYSRRIGGAPVNYLDEDEEEEKGYKIIQNPLETKMINGTKVSGRTESGLGVGVFNAVVGRQHATLEDSEGNQFEKETQPLTNYNILVLDQSLKNNSYVTLVNTNVMRQGSTYDANLTGGLFRFANKQNKYAINGKAALSQHYFSDSTALGYTYNVNIGKISGNFLYSLGHSVISDTYDPNDMGILFTNNTIDESINLSYNVYQSFWKFLNAYAELSAVHSRRYDTGKFQNFAVNTRLGATLKNFLSVGLSSSYEPVLTYDYFEPRVAGRYYTFPVNYSVGGYISSNYNKKFALDVELFYRDFDENNRHNLDFVLSPRYRVNNKLNFVYRYSMNERFDDIGYADKDVVKDDAEKVLEERIIFGLRNVNTVENTLTGNYIFNNKMSLSLRARHYLSKVANKKYFSLTPDGNLLADAHNESHDRNYNIFNVDMVYSWWFAPGSEISIVWKNLISNDADKAIPSYFDNFSRTFSSPQTNSLSVKVLYYIDYNTIKNKLSKPKA